jgi:two-component system, OmpR family, phosphate regulon sensor histidine kinase PhoR
LRKVGLLILAIIVLPVLIFSGFEIGNLRQNEKVIQDIYKNQLEAILYSINQYSDDIINNLASRIENSQNSFKSDQRNDLQKLIIEIPSVQSLIQFNKKNEYLASFPDSVADPDLIAKLKTDIDKNSKKIIQLQTYLRGGYRKIETLPVISGDFYRLVFLTDIKDQEVVNIVIIDPEKFITQVLDPKIQAIAKGKFDIAAFRADQNIPFYTSNKQKVQRTINNRESFWLFKDYLMGIELKDLTIEDLTSRRVRKNILLLGFMDLILIFGAFLIYRNVSKQVELSQLKSDFVSGVSHEIRTPLALITMYIETLEMGRVKEASKIKEYYSIILNETTRLSGIVNRILSFSQIESNKRKYSFTFSDINELIENAALSLKYSFDTKGFSFSFLPGSDLPQVNVDRDAVTDAFVNLVDNAMKYSTDKKKIIVSTFTTNNYACIEVEDEGIGISAKDQKYIFDKFFRVTETNLANRVKGSGLGLAIVKHIMDAHGGKIGVKSSPGEGSVFRLLFPINRIKNHEKNSDS